MSPIATQTSGNARLRAVLPLTFSCVLGETMESGPFLDPMTALVQWAVGFDRRVAEELSAEGLGPSTGTETYVPSPPEERRVRLLALLDAMRAEGQDTDQEWWDDFSRVLREQRFRL